MRRETKILTCVFVACLFLLSGSLFFILPHSDGQPVSVSAYFENEQDRVNVNKAPAAGTDVSGRYW